MKLQFCKILAIPSDGVMTSVSQVYGVHKKEEYIIKY